MVFLDLLAQDKSKGMKISRDCVMKRYHEDEGYTDYLYFREVEISGPDALIVWISDHLSWLISPIKSIHFDGSGDIVRITLNGEDK